MYPAIIPYRSEDAHEEEDIKSPIRATLSSTDSAVLISAGEEWSYVCTDDGIAGYILNNDITIERQVNEEGPYVEPEYPRVSDRQNLCIAWHQVFNNSGVDSIDSLLSNSQGVTTLSPTWFRLTDSLGNITSIASREIGRAHV